MSLLPAPNCAFFPLRHVSSTPVEEYIAILRSYLSVEQRTDVRLRVERLCKKRMISSMQYAEILQRELTPLQKAGALERLETVFSERGWLSPRAA